MPFSLTQIDNHLVKLIIEGDVTKYSVLDLCQEIDAVMGREIKRLNIISDITRLGKVSAEARHLLAAHNKGQRVGKIALVGFNQKEKILAHFILVESKRNNIYFFDTAIEAESWLLEKYSE